MISKATISLITALEHKKYREERGLFVAEGTKLVGDMRRQIPPHTVFCSDPAVALAGDVPVDVAEMKRISFLKTPSPVLALFPLPPRVAPPQPAANKLLLALDDVQDPGNLGTIIRLCSWFGIDALVCSPHCADCYSPKVVQAAMGALADVHVHYAPLPEFLERATSENVPVMGTFMSGENLYHASLPAGGIVVVGSEGQGISPQVSRCIPRRISIPAFAPANRHVESLNVSIATAIVCAELRRRGA